MYNEIKRAKGPFLESRNLNLALKILHFFSNPERSCLIPQKFIGTGLGYIRCKLKQKYALI